MKRLLVALLLLSGTAHAQVKFATSLRLVPQSSAPSNLTGNVGLWANSGNSNHLTLHQGGLDLDLQNIVNLGITPSTLGNFLVDNGAGALTSMAQQTYDARNYASFSAAVTAIGSTPATLTISTTLSVPASVTVPSTLTLQFLPTGKLSISSGQTVTINGQLLAPRNQIFSGAGTVVLSGTATPKLPVEWFGAICDSVADDTTPIQTTINVAAAAVSPAGQYPTVTLPGGKSCLTSKPLRINGDQQSLVGEGAQGQQARIFSSAGGPLLIVAPPSYTGIPVVAGLHGGTAIQLPSTNQHFNLRMDGNALGDLNGLANFSAEVWIQPNTIAAGIQSIIGSAGRRGQTDTTHIAFQLYQSGTTLGGKLSVGATTYSLACAAVLAVSTTTHVAITYDGTTIRLFQGGTSCATQAASGTITQTDFEDLDIGPLNDGWPDVTNLFNGFTGVIDTFRVSNIPRYVANFTPSNTLPTDGNALYQGDWSQIYDISARMHGNGGTAWAPIRSNALGAAISQTVIRHLTLDGSGASNGLYVFYGHHWILEDLRIPGGTYSYVNLLLWENPFIGAIKDLEIGSARVGMIASVAAGIIGVEKANFIGGRYEFVAANASVELTNPFFQPSNATVNSVMGLNVNTGLVMTNPLWDIEFAVGTYQNCIYLSGTGKSYATFIGADIQSTLAIPAVLVDAWGSLTVLGGVATTSGESEVFHFNSSPQSPANIVGMFQQFGTTVPWCGGTGTNLCAITPSSATFPSLALSNATNQLTIGATGHVDAISATAPAAASNTLTIPDTGGNDTFVFNTLAGTLANKTLTAPVINGATSSGSTAIDLSGNSGAFKTPTGANTFGGSSNTFTNGAAMTGSLAINGGASASGAAAIDLSGSTGNFKTSTGTWTIGGSASGVGGSLNGGTANSVVNLASSGLAPNVNGVIDLGSQSGRWANVYTNVLSAGLNFTTNVALTIKASVQTSGAVALMLVSPPANTGQTAGTEVNSINYALATRTWLTGNIPLQREYLIQAPTHAFAGASIITADATLDITGPPIAGANATITKPYALRLEAGAMLDGSTTFSSLPPLDNGAHIYCSDCAAASVGAACAGSGTGKLAIRENGAWQCF